ncbi:MAG: hypothetical protein QF790_07750 [Gammaproteobacteria bacterium]|jgi:hypothetical protein|nr:hypothetical protein [Gammaproteobacteria bacterium]MDP6617040.1 hypothetical protein [Gammaproteobacteria bacterium]MDP6695068.1 hypothetical protein [Gammaproteobacteria bacterium]MDP7041613.1 hypothetical protein [Gammaproteobacteria bacterium]
MNQFKWILAITALAVSGLASGALERIEEGMELTLDQVRLPAHTADQLTVDACADCDQFVLKVDAATRYIQRTDNHDQALSHQAFRQAARAAKRSLDETPVLVFYKPATRTVTRVILITG